MDKAIKLANSLQETFGKNAADWAFSNYSTLKDFDSTRTLAEHYYQAGIIITERGNGKS